MADLSPAAPAPKRPFQENDRDALAATTDWLAGLLRQQTSTGKRVMSPPTEANVRAMLAKCERARSAETAEDTLAGTSLDIMRREINRRLELDAKYATAREKLERVEQEAWFIRYGDYHAAALSSLKGEARATAKKWRLKQKRQAIKAAVDAAALRPITGPSIGPSTGPTSLPPAPPLTLEELMLETFITEPFVEVDRMLTEEEEAARDREEGEAVATPMTDLIKKLVRQMPPQVMYRHIRGSVAIYSRRNQLAHGQCARMADDGQFLDLATKLNKDLNDVHLRPTISEAERSATTAAIWSMINQFFERFERNSDTGDLKAFVIKSEVDERSRKRVKQKAAVEKERLAAESDTT